MEMDSTPRHRKLLLCAIAFTILLICLGSFVCIYAVKPGTDRISLNSNSRSQHPSAPASGIYKGTKPIPFAKYILSKYSPSKEKLAIIVGVLIVLALVVIFGTIYVHRASRTVNIQPKKLESSERDPVQYFYDNAPMLLALIACAVFAIMAACIWKIFGHHQGAPASDSNAKDALVNAAPAENPDHKDISSEHPVDKNTPAEYDDVKLVGDVLTVGKFSINVKDYGPNDLNK